MFAAAEYFEQIAKQTIDEFFADLDNPRRGMLACMALIHTVDHVFQNRFSDGKRADKMVRAFTRKASENTASGAEQLHFAVVRGFANASKHARLTADSLNKGFGSKDFEIAAPGRVDEFVIDNSFLEDEVGGVTIRWGENVYVNLK